MIRRRAPWLLAGLVVAFGFGPVRAQGGVPVDRDTIRLARSATPSIADPVGDSLPVTDNSPLHAKADYFLEDLVDKHWLDGLYISIVPTAPRGTKLRHTVNEPGNVIHAGVWTGRYLAGVGYRYAVTRDAAVREHAWTILRALRVLQEVTGKPGLLARGYVRGHGPVEGWERDGRNSVEWHQGQGRYADYRWYGDVSVDNFNAILYGYAIYHDLAADAAQKEFIRHDVDRLMTHLLEHHCRIVDVDEEVTRWGHVGMDPDPSRDDYYRKVYARYLDRLAMRDAPWRPPLRSSLMLLPDLLIAHRITGEQRHLKLYHSVVERFGMNPDRRRRFAGLSPLERQARTDHSSEGQAYEALYNLIRYESDPELLRKYRGWLTDLWDANWREGNSLFAFMTMALLPEHHEPSPPEELRTNPGAVPHGEEGMRLARETLRRFPVDRVFRPVMNSLRGDLERNPHARERVESAAPVPIDERPLDNEYAWKANPYQMDGWMKPTVRMFQLSCDDPQVAWFCDSGGHVFLTRDGGSRWTDVTGGLMGARVQAILASKTRTFVLHARTDRGVFLTRDGGLSWRAAPPDDAPEFPSPDFSQWLRAPTGVLVRVGDGRALVISRDGGETSAPCMTGWRIPLADSVFTTPLGIVASGPGGCYRSDNAETWTELRLWPEQETGAADFLHAYWMGRYYGFIEAGE